MRVLVFDPFRGAAGDMVCGALLHLGADSSAVVRAMASVVAEPLVQEVKRAGIRGLLVDTHAPVVHRTLGQVLEIVSRAEAPAEARSMAGQVFHRIARAEEEIHGEHAHFHDVGADDAIAEVVDAAGIGRRVARIRPIGVVKG